MRLAVVVLPAGILLIAIGWGMDAATLLVPGVALLVVGLLGLVSLLVIGRSLSEKELALRESGTVQLLTFMPDETNPASGTQQLTSELQILLDSGHTLSGPYWAHIGPLDATKFHVGATLRCLVNPTSPDVVQVFPSAAPGDALPLGRSITFSAAKFKQPRH